MTQKSTNDFRGASFGGGFAARDYIGDVTHHYASEKNLTEAAAEIQELLEQLDKTYPTDTITGQMQAAKEVITEIEGNMPLANRILNAIKTGGIEALKQTLNHPAATFVLTAIEEWQKTKNKAD